MFGPFDDPAFLGYIHECEAERSSSACISRVANTLAASSNDIIDTEEFREACYSNGVDPDSFDSDDLDALQSILDDIT